MFPLKDDIPSSRVPIVNFLLITLNVLVFLFELSQGSRVQLLITDYGIVPARSPDLISAIPTLFTSMFLHGGWGHLFGNMLYLWIFGDNVEDRFGHVGYLFIYLACGVCAGIAHILTNAGSHVPTVGASGAIAGVLGAYFVLFPRARVLSVTPFGLVYISASFFLGIWFVLQLFSGAVQLGIAHTGGVAFLAHVGGFIAGAFSGILARALAREPAQA